MRVKENPHTKYLVLAGILALCCLLSAGVIHARSGDTDKKAELVMAANQLSATVPLEETPAWTLANLPNVSFRDVPAESGDYDTLRYLCFFSYLTGANGAFAPAQPVDRAALISALYRISGESGEGGELACTDVALEDADAVAWAYGAGLLEGIAGEETFGPGENITRGQLAVVLHRFASYMGWTDQPEAAGTEETATLNTGETAGTEEMAALSTEETADTEEMAALSTEETVSADKTAALSTQPAQGTDAEALLETAAAAEETAALEWVLEEGLYKTMVAPQPEAAQDSQTHKILVRVECLPEMAVSRMQLAHALMGLLALGGDELAAEIFAALPEKTAEESISWANHGDIQAQVDALARKYSADGLQVAVVENGRVTDTYNYGWATKTTDPMTEDHKIRCASISKVLVGVAAMLLQEDGVVSLDAGIGEYWGITAQNPYYQETPVNIRALLTHTSSIINAGDDVSRAYESVKSKLQGSGYSKLVPGAAGSWSYNNYAFGVLGMTLELASGQYLDDVLHEGLFDLMDIDAAYYAGDLENTDLLANIYRADGSVGRSVETQKGLHRGDFPGASGSPFAGGLTISARDLAKVAGLLASDGRYEGVQLLSEESVERMETCFAVSDGSSQGMPLRCRTDIYGRDMLYYHTGSAYGVYNFFSYDPATGDGVVVLTTGASGAKDANNVYAVCGEISAYIYGILEQ